MTDDVTPSQAGSEVPTAHQSDDSPGLLERLGLPGTGSKSLTLHRAVTVARPASALYEHWRNLENLPRWMTHLETVRETGPGRAHWVARLPGDERLEWDTEISADVPNERIAWRSVGDAAVQNAGEVRFRAAPGGRGTEVHLMLDYQPPGGGAGKVLASLFDEVTAEMLQDELRHFKQLVEAGEIATIEGQPSGPVA